MGVPKWFLPSIPNLHHPCFHHYHLHLPSKHSQGRHPWISLNYIYAKFHKVSSNSSVLGSSSHTNHVHSCLPSQLLVSPTPRIPLPLLSSHFYVLHPSKCSTQGPFLSQPPNLCDLTYTGLQKYNLLSLPQN